MRKIYTKTGDKGMTGIHGGERVPKDDIRIEANGCIDELNSVIGIIRSLLLPEDDRQELLYKIQTELMVVMSHVATPSALHKAGMENPGSGNPNTLNAASLTKLCEQTIDEVNTAYPDNGYFLLPGGTQLSAQLHFARTVARRAERRLWTLHRQDPVNSDIMCLMNRLSDLFFVMARAELHRQNWEEERWQAFAYKRKKR